MENWLLRSWWLDSNCFIASHEWGVLSRFSVWFVPDNIFDVVWFFSFILDSSWMMAVVSSGHILHAKWCFPLCSNLLGFLKLKKMEHYLKKQSIIHNATQGLVKINWYFQYIHFPTKYDIVSGTFIEICFTMIRAIITIIAINVANWNNIKAVECTASNTDMFTY